MQPLLGVRIVVTRAAHQVEELARPLRSLGADVILLPTIGISPPSNSAPLREAATHRNEYDWIIFTSVNAIQAFSAAIQEPLSCCARIAAIGPATAQAIEEHGLVVSLTPEKYTAESLGEAFVGYDLQNRRVLIPSAAVTRDVVPKELRKLGARVDVVEAYRNVLPPETARKASEVFREPLPDWVVFASPSAVENLLLLIGPEPLRKVSIATIGPATSQTVLKNRLTVTTEASAHTIPGLVEAIVRRY